MIQFDRAQQKIAFSLFVVAIIATSMLAFVDQVTKEPIAEAQRAALHKSLQQVLPEHSNDVLQEMFTFSIGEDKAVKVYPARDKQGKVIAYAWEQVAPDGYSGSIRILMGVRASGEIVAIRVTEHRETPGLGDGITKNAAWLQRFVDKTLNNIAWAVKKDGGDFDQFTGATITPRAVVKAVHAGLTMYKTNSAALYKALQEADKKLLDEKFKLLEKKAAGGKTS